VVNLLLMLRWRSLIHPFARIEYPLRLRLARGVRIGRCKLVCRGHGPAAIQLGTGTVLHDGTILDALDGLIDIGPNTTVNPYCVLYGTGGLRIGAWCGIAAHTVIVAANHGHERTDVPMMAQPVRGRGITIDDDVWLGSGSRVLDGTHVEHGCIVAAGAVVRGHVAAGSIVGGVPARRLRMRQGFGS